MGLPENVFPGIMIALWPGCFLWECIIYWGEVFRALTPPGELKR
jgi:hypothetical protein